MIALPSLSAVLVPLPVILPLLGAAVCLVFGRSARMQRGVSFVVLSVSVAVAATLLLRADRLGPQVVHVGGWPARLGISLVADRLSALLLLISAIVTLTVLAYSLGQGIVEFGRDTPLSVFHPTFLVLSAGVSNAFLAGDLFNLYVGFEILLVASYVLITLGGSGPRIRAGTTYVVVSLVSSMLFLLAIAGVYAAAGTVNLADLSERLWGVSPSVRLALQLMLLCAFAVKAAVFPLAAWLPDSYPSAPAPVTAVFAGLLTKVGVYAIIRTQTLLFPDSRLSGLLLWAALLTMLVGILGAIVQADLKRMLSFTLVSHVGYLLLGVALSSALGLAGTIFYVVHHITIQTTLFLVAGLVELRSGTSHLGQLGGLAKAAPILALMFFIPAMNLAGIPPFSGFLGKVALIQAGVRLGTPLAYVLVTGAVVTSLLTLYAVAKAWNRAFWQPVTAEAGTSEAGTSGVGRTDAGTSDARADAAEGGTPPAWSGRAATAGSTMLAEQPAPPGTASGGAWDEVPQLAERNRLPFGMALPALALVIVGLALTVFAGPLFALSQRAAAELRDPEVYRTAVFEAPTAHVLDATVPSRFSLPPPSPTQSVPALGWSR